jgi:hypothetical protein
LAEEVMVLLRTIKKLKISSKNIHELLWCWTPIGDAFVCKAWNRCGIRGKHGYLL